jgi:LPXTG-motif cell wall-anchored protein
MVPLMKKLILGVTAAVTLLLGLPTGAGAQSAPVITLLHGIPGVTVDVFVGGTEVVPDFAPGATQDLSAFAGQTLSNIEVKLQDGTVAITVPSLAVPTTGNYTVIAHLDAAGTPKISVFQNDTSAVPAGQGRVVVRHAAAAPAVDIVAGTARPVTNLANGAEQALVLPAGPLAGLQVAPTGGDPIADVPTVNVVEGNSLIVYAVGSISSEPATFTFLTQTIVLTLPATGADDVLVQAGIGTLIVLAGAGLIVAASRRRAVAA